MPNKLDLAKLAQALKNVGDTGAALIQDCTSRAKDGAVEGADMEPVKQALLDCWNAIAPTPAEDTDPALAEQETLKRKQEVATGDRKKANDSRGGAYNTDYSVDAIFGGSKHDGEGTSPIAPTVNEIFGGSTKLAEG